MQTVRGSDGETLAIIPRGRRAEIGESLWADLRNSKLAGV